MSAEVSEQEDRLQPMPHNLGTTERDTGII